MAIARIAINVGTGAIPGVGVPETGASVSLVIVSYNGRDLLCDCLESIQAQIRPPDETIVVDNGSSDGTPSRVRERFPWVALVEAQGNLGFAGGNNLGIRRSSGDIIVLLNNDTLASPGFISEIVKPIMERDEIGSVAGTLLFSNAPDRVASAGIEVFENGLALDRHIGRRWLDLPQGEPVFGASAGAVAYRRAALDQSGLFSEPFFLYLEDVDLAWRLRWQGWECVHACAAHVLHAYSASEGKGPAPKHYYMARNRVRTLVRCWPLLAWRNHWWRVGLYELGALAFGVATLNRHAISGRLGAWLDLRELLRERRSVLAGARAGDRQLLYWIRSSPRYRDVVRLGQEIRRYAEIRPLT
jgi:GT2 family glycosyltransferase